MAIKRSYNQIDVSSAELNQRYHENDERRRALEREIREIEQAGIATMSGPDQRATEGPRRERNRILKAKLRDHLSAEQWAEYTALQARLADNQRELKQLPPRENVLGLARYNKITAPTRILQRGNPNSPSDEVAPQFPDLFDDADSRVRVDE